MARQILIIFLVSLTLGAYAASAYLYLQNQTLQSQLTSLQSQPTPTPTPNPDSILSSWKTYQDDRGNFTFEYPAIMPDFTVDFPPQPGQPTDRRSTYVWQVDKLPSGDYDHHISYRIVGPYANTSKLSLKSWLASQNQPNKEGTYEQTAVTVNIASTTINDIPVILEEIREHDQPLPRSWAIYFNTKDGIYKIYLDIQGTPSETYRYQEIKNHSFSTFQLTAPITSWITYTNKEFGFEIKHPEIYHEFQDKAGWPNSIVIITRFNRQSYDLVIEAWNSKSDYQTKYGNQNYVNKLKVFPIQNGKYLTLLNTNGDEQVDQIISTFKFTK